MIGSRYFAAKHFSSRYMGGIPQTEVITIRPPVAFTRSSGGSMLDFYKQVAMMQAKRKKEDEEILGLLMLFAFFEEQEDVIF